MNRRVSSPFERDVLANARDVLFTMRRAVRFQDVDAAGTIYFPRILEYFADAYVELLLGAGLDVPKLLKEKRWAAPLAHAEADFLRPLFFGDVVDVDVVALKVGKTSATFGHRLRDASGKAAAIGHTVHVFVDPTTFQPIAVPKELAAIATVRPPP
jgi:YbgC/YbaW family acyl-CoA thioester hydrolase